MNYDDLKLSVNATANQLELNVNGLIAFIEFRLFQQMLFLIHTEVPPALQGKGLAGAIVGKALQYAKDNNYKIVPICPVVQTYLKRHPEWNAIVAPDAAKIMNEL